jgi:hypothetical protein
MHDDLIVVPHVRSCPKQFACSNRHVDGHRDGHRDRHLSSMLDCSKRHCDGHGDGHIASRFDCSNRHGDGHGDGHIASRFDCSNLHCDPHGDGHISSRSDCSNRHCDGHGDGHLPSKHGVHDVGINAVSVVPPGPARTAAMRFHVAPVQRPLASAVKVVQAGNRIMMSSEGSFIENMKTGERMPLRVERGTFVFDVMYTGGQSGTITLDSGAGVNVWPEGLLREVPMGPPDAS